MRIRWTETAAQDFTGICDYIKAQSSPTVARRVALAIYERADSLSQFPHSGRPGRKHDTREMVISNLPFVVVYRVRADVVEILRILHTSQKWP
ncbi:MAG: type II toxin-antitoxin system RelE/ParE family toxin [Acidobacteria bacterium]|nr:type II toxin-antitoxin system RelE/ParE family toxin [Acidobacteriota bacterium]